MKKIKFHLECLVCSKTLDNYQANCTHFVVRTSKK